MDNLIREQRRKNMQNIRSKDTRIEVELRKALWHRWYWYRKNDKRLLGKPDIVLIRYKIAIFCDSEFFHGKDWEVLKPRLEKGNNSQYWINKISKTGNVMTKSIQDFCLRGGDGHRVLGERHSEKYRGVCEDCGRTVWDVKNARNIEMKYVN